MPTFTWRDTITVSVGEMSRTAALECMRDFDSIVSAFSSYDDLMRELDVIGVLHAPAVVKVNGEIITGERVVQIDDESVRFVLPLTRECLNALPFTLSSAWINAMVTGNEWLVEAIKKVFSLTLESISELKSGNEQSSKSQMTQ